jgi:hypothetical protein
MKPTVATTRFFEMPELVVHLAHHFLDQRSISCLMRTSRHLYAFCTPALFYEVDIFDGYDPEKGNLLASKQSIEVFARNVRHVRQLELYVLDMVYYVNCVFAYLDQDQSSTQPSPVKTFVAEEQDAQEQEQDAQEQEQDTTIVSRPRWLAPPDPRISAVFPIPPMTLLTRLDLDLGYNVFTDDCPYFSPSYKDPRATLTQTCWLLDLNSHLLDLRLENVLMKDQRDIRLLTRSIFRLKRLQNVRLDFFRWEEMEEEEEEEEAGERKSAAAATRRLAVAIFFSCPPSVRTLYINISQRDSFWIHDVTEEYKDLGPEQPQSWETSCSDDGDDDEYGGALENELAVATLQLRNEATANLTCLHVWHDDLDRVSEDDFRRMLVHCPNLTDIVIPLIHSIQNVRQLAEDIAQRLCPKLTTFGEIGCYGTREHRELVVRILETLPEQQAQKFICLAQSFTIPGLNDEDTRRMFQRQSRTLRELRLKGWWDANSKVIQVILVECIALEQLEVRFWDEFMCTFQQWDQGRQPLTLCIDLEDAIEFPWGCTKIRDLNLTIAIPNEPFRHLGKGEIPYYNRPFPTILTEAEIEQFRSLEAFYQQLGALTELERLNPQAVYYDPTGSRRLSKTDRRDSFPGMLNLRNDETGRPGYLHHLGGLNKLRDLFGWASSFTEEPRVTIGMEEEQWMDRHWPALERAHFFTSKNEKMFTEPFQQLLKQRAGSDKPVQLSASY